MKKRIVLIIVLGFVLSGIFSNSYAISIVVDNFNIIPDLVVKNGDGAVTGGTSYGMNTNGGVSVATFYSASSSSSSSWLWPFGWYDYSNAQAWHWWKMEGHLTGDIGEEAEILADWKFWAFSVLTAYSSGLRPSSNTATAVVSGFLNVHGYNTDGYFNQQIPIPSFYDKQQVMWMGAGGESEINEGTISLGTFSVDPSNYLKITGAMYIQSESYSNPFGSCASNTFGSANFDLSLVDKNNPVPEPATMMLFGIGFLGLAGVSRIK